MSDRSHGFTLIETLVALVLFAGIFAALAAGISGGSRGVRLARMDMTATMLARAKLAAAGVEAPITDGQLDSGEDGGFAWGISVQQLNRAEGEFRETELKAYWVTVDVSWREGPFRPLRTIQLKGLKLGSGS